MSLMKSNPLAREGVPVGYREVLYWRISDKRWQMIIVNLLALLSLVLWLFLFRWLGLEVGRMPQSGAFGLPQIVLVLAGAPADPGFARTGTRPGDDGLRRAHAVRRPLDRANGLRHCPRPRVHALSLHSHRPGAAGGPQSSGAAWHDLAGRHAMGQSFGALRGWQCSSCPAATCGL